MRACRILAASWTCRNGRMRLRFTPDAAAMLLAMRSEAALPAALHSAWDAATLAGLAVEDTRSSTANVSYKTTSVNPNLQVHHA